MEQVTTARRIRRERRLKAFKASHARDGNLLTIKLGGSIALRNCANLWVELHRMPPKPGDSVRIDLSDVQRVDGTASALLVSFRSDLEQAGVNCKFEGAQDSPAELLRLYEREASVSHPQKRKAQGILDQIGA